MTDTQDASILLVDLAHLVHQQWHVSGSEPDPNWVSQQAVAIVRRLANGQTPHVAICSDLGRSFRKDIDPTYKANRPEANAPLIHQLRTTEDALRADGYPVWAIAGFEADDLIATATKMAVDAGYVVAIATNDKDLYQLVSGSVLVRSTKTDDLIGPDEVQAKFGVRPDQMRDYLTLVGDTSDNIQGAKGVGPKTAAGMLAKYQTLDAIMEHISEFSPALQRALTEGFALERARALVTLRTDAPIPFDELFAPPAQIQETVMPETVEAFTVEPIPVSDPPPAPSSRAMVVSSQTPTPIFDRGLEPRDMDEAAKLANAMFKSRLFSAYGTPEAVLSTIMAGRELGLPAMASLRAFHVVEGKPTMSADIIRALVLSSGRAEYFLPVTRTATEASWRTKRKDSPEPFLLSYTIEEATAAGLVKAASGWAKFPADMLAKTASTKLCRLIYSDVCFGLYAPAEFGRDE